MANVYAAQDGNWSDTATWTGGVVPTTGDRACCGPYAVTLDQDIIYPILSSANDDWVADGNSALSTSHSGRFIAADGINATITEYRYDYYQQATSKYTFYIKNCTLNILDVKCIGGYYYFSGDVFVISAGDANEDFDVTFNTVEMLASRSGKENASGCFFLVGTSNTVGSFNLTFNNLPTVTQNSGDYGYSYHSFGSFSSGSTAASGAITFNALLAQGINRPNTSNNYLTVTGNSNIDLVFNNPTTDWDAFTRWAEINFTTFKTATFENKVEFTGTVRPFCVFTNIIEKVWFKAGLSATASSVLHGIDEVFDFNDLAVTCEFVLDGGLSIVPTNGVGGKRFLRVGHVVGVTTDNPVTTINGGITIHRSDNSSGYSYIHTAVKLIILTNSNLTINGDVIGKDALTQCLYIYIGDNRSLTINGNVDGSEFIGFILSSGNHDEYEFMKILTGGTPDHITINGDVIGSDDERCAYREPTTAIVTYEHNGLPANGFIITGDVYGTKYVPALKIAGTSSVDGEVIVQGKVIGNTQSTKAFAEGKQTGVITMFFGAVYCNTLEMGIDGTMPTCGGRVLPIDAETFTVITHNPDATPTQANYAKTLGTAPNAEDVREGVTFDIESVGTLKVPNPAYVSLGVETDDTVGSLTGSAVIGA